MKVLNIYNIFPWYALLLLAVLEILIILKAYNGNELFFSLLFALVQTLYPIIFIKLGWLDLFGLEREEFIQYYDKFNNLLIEFVIQYIIAFITFKFTNAKISGTSGRIVYLLIFIIINSIIFTIISNFIPLA